MLGIHWKASPNKFSLAATSYLFHPWRHVNIYGHHGIDEHRWFCLLGDISDLSYMFFQIWYLGFFVDIFNVGQVSFIEQVLAFLLLLLLLLLLLIFCLIHHHPYIFFYYCYSSSYFVNFSSKLAMWLCGQWRICSEALVPTWLIQI